MTMAWRLPTYIILTLVTIGPLGSYSGLLGPDAGFGLFFMGVVLAAVFGMIFAGAAAFAAAWGRSWRPQALKAALVPVLLFLIVFATRLRDPAPMINDITTDLENPPAMRVDVAAAASPLPEADEPTDLAEIQRAAYPDIQPVSLSLAPAQAFEQALAIAEANADWEIIEANAVQGIIRATSTSKVFRFVDDIVIRLTPEGAGTRIDMRSKSRLGRGDLGANAARIRQFLSALQAG